MPHAIAYGNTMDCNNPSSAPYPEVTRTHVAVAVPPRQNNDAGRIQGRPAGACASKYSCLLFTAAVIDLIFWGLASMLILDGAGVLELGGLGLFFISGFLGIAYLIHWGFVCKSPIIALDGKPIGGVDALEAYVAQLHATQPFIVMSIVCSHSQSSTTTDADGTTSSSTETVTTHRAEQAFRYDDVVDASAPFVIPLQENIIRLDLGARSVFADAHTAELFEAEYRSFIVENTRDTDVWHSWRCILPGLVPSRLVVVRGRLSCAMHPVWYCLMAFFCLDGLFGLLFANAAGELDYEIVKSIKRRT
jgi:hypothetical protein